MYRVFKRDGRVPHLWMILFASLALAALYLFELVLFANENLASWHSASAASALEPTFSPPQGHYDRDIQLQILAPDPGADVIFTVDGSVPTRSTGTVYTRPIRLSAIEPGVTVIRARLLLPDGRLGPVVGASYFVGVQATLPLMSLIMEPDDLWGQGRGIYINPFGLGDAWERPVDITYVDKDRRSGFYIPAGIRIHGHASRDFEKKSLRLYFRQEYGASRLEYPLFSTVEGARADVQSFKRLVLHSGAQDSHVFPYLGWTLMRNQLMDRLAFQLGGYAVRSQPVLLFINGEPWGIYHVRERIDRYFLADHYGVDSADFLDSPGSDLEEVRMGDGENWEHLMQFLETHDMADPANYAYVQSQIDVANFIDYYVLQIYAANGNWPYHNVHQFRPRVQGGRWRWMFWDSDHGFGLTQAGGQVDTDMMEVLEQDHRKTGGRDVLLFRKLLENRAFRDRFLSRAAGLLNTTLAPQSVIAHIDALAAELEPDIAYETVRWSSSTDWASNVEGLRDFARRRPDFVREHMVGRFGLEGTARLTFDPPDAGSGTVAVDGLLVPDLPWQGVYFQGVPVRVVAAPAPGYRFAGWDAPDLPQTPAITLTVGASRTIAPRFEAIGDDVPRSGDVVFADHRIGEDSHVEGGWFELRVMHPGGVDLRGWRVTDNDTKTATDEGSLIFADRQAFARVPRGTTMRIVVRRPSTDLPADDLNAWDLQMVLYVGNENLDVGIDPGFNLGPDDSLVLLAPGPTEAFDDDRGIAFVAVGTAVTPASFGVLADGVLPASAGARPGQQAHDRPGEEIAVPTWLFTLAGLVVLGFGAYRAVKCRKNVYQD